MRKGQRETRPPQEAYAVCAEKTWLPGVGVAAEPPDLGSLISDTFLKSLATVTSPEFADSVPSKLVFNITKKPPNSSTALNPCPPFGSIITSNSVLINDPPP